MPFCVKCGAEVSENVNFCNKCGSTVTPNGGNATQGEQVSTVSGNKVPALWNPKAAVWWSLLFAFLGLISALPGPILGPILNYLNWKTLGKNKEARLAKIFAILIFICSFFSLIFFEFILEPTEYKLLVPATFIVLLPFMLWGLWSRHWFVKKATIKQLIETGKTQMEYEMEQRAKLMGTGKTQIEYVAEKYGTEYKRRSWLAPLGISFVICGIFFALQFFILTKGEIISIVKENSLEECPEYTIVNVVNSVMFEPEWKVNEYDETKLVSVSGALRHTFKQKFNDPKPEKLGLDFVVDTDSEESDLIALYLDDKEQPGRTAKIVIDLMCKAASTSGAKKAGVKK